MNIQLYIVARGMTQKGTGDGSATGRTGRRAVRNRDWHASHHRFGTGKEIVA